MGRKLRIQCHQIDTVHIVFCSMLIALPTASYMLEFSLICIYIMAKIQHCKLWSSKSFTCYVASKNFAPISASFSFKLSSYIFLRKFGGTYSNGGTTPVQRSGIEPWWGALSQWTYHCTMRPFAELHLAVKQRVDTASFGAFWDWVSLQ
jgi:hypothetical protein